MRLVKHDAGGQLRHQAQVQQESAALQQPSFPHNARGQTYGSSAFSKAPADDPDLILVVATNGQEGYVQAGDLNGPTPRTPEEAAAMSKTPPRSIPVFLSDGQTQIGIFIVGQLDK